MLHHYNPPSVLGFIWEMDPETCSRCSRWCYPGKKNNRNILTIVSATCSLSVFLVWYGPWQWSLDSGARLIVVWLVGWMCQICWLYLEPWSPRTFPRGLKLPISWHKTGLEFLAVNQTQISTVPIEHYETSTDIYHRYLPQISTNETWNVAADLWSIAIFWPKQRGPVAENVRRSTGALGTTISSWLWKWFIMIHHMWFDVIYIL